MTLHGKLDGDVSDREAWALRRRRGISNNKQLFVLTCMDERIPVEEALGLELGDAHIFRNAGAVVTDDVIRSAALTTHFFGTKEIVILLHTECGMLTADGEDIAALWDKHLAEHHQTTLEDVSLDPGSPDLQVPRDKIGAWVRTFTDVDEAAIEQESLLRDHPLIPDDVPVHAYIYEVESGRVRRPRAVLGKVVSEAPGAVIEQQPANPALQAVGPDARHAEDRSFATD
ncbi:MAG: carbonic anhydrase [Planctomycetota bacterium]